MVKGSRLLALILAIVMCLSLSSVAFADAAHNFKLAIVRWTDSWGTAFEDAAILKEISKATNTNITWNAYYWDNWSEQKSLLLASGDLPDAFFGSITLTDADIAQNKAYFVDLTDYIPTCMPNLSAIFKADPTLKALCTDRDGRIYSLPKKLPLRPKTANETYINKVWLDKLGLPMPTTYKELESVLEAFVTKDPNGNGVNDEAGYSNTASCAGDINNLMIPFGTQASRANNYMGLNAAGEPYFVPAADNYREGVKWVHELYTKGLIDAERFTQTSDMVSAKTNAPDGAQVGIVFAWTADAGVGVNASQFAVVPALAGPDGNRYVEADPTFLNYGKNELVVTTACKDVEGLLRWADAFYTDEVSLQTYYGSIADGKIAKDGDTYTVLVPSDGTSLDTSCWTNSFRDHGPKYMNTAFESKVVLPTDQGDGIKLADDKVNAEFVRDTFPVCAYTDDQLIRLAALTTDIKNYVEQTYAHWVVDGGTDAEWDAYVAQLNQMGLEEYVSIYTDAYNVYKGK